LHFLFRNFFLSSRFTLVAVIEASQAAEPLHRQPFRNQTGKVMKTNAKSTSAFTLIEIMVVITIIGVLAAMAVPNILESVEKSRRETCVINLKNIEGAKVRWAAEHRKLSTETPSNDDLFGKGKYIRDILVCPAGGAYSLNPVDDRPTCSVAGHSY
jgi:prepilin-type N-terminal cleavage/methylation domain-containing protein